MLHLTSNWKGGKKSQEVVAVFGGEDPQRLLRESEREPWQILGVEMVQQEVQVIIHSVFLLSDLIIQVYIN